MILGIEGVAGAYYAAQQRHLAMLTPERERREVQERIDREPEVLLALRCIAQEALVGANADRLIAFARDLAQRRLCC